jgi:protein-tyrosine phosphatase
MVADGVTAVVATPHVRGDYPNSPEGIESAVADMRRALAEDGVRLRVLAGAEVELGRLSELEPAELRRLTIGGQGFLLIEFPYRGWPTGLVSALDQLRTLGLTAVLGHPERNPEVQDRPARLAEVVAGGALVQVTAGSLCGDWGAPARSAARRLLELDLVHVVATDLHRPESRRSTLAQGAAAVGDAALADWLTRDAPAAIVEGQPPPPRPVAG